jgi:hypothetical protein
MRVEMTSSIRYQMLQDERTDFADGSYTYLNYLLNAGGTTVD